MFNVKVTFTKDSPYFKNGILEQTYKNVTEIHYRYPPMKDRVALESDVEGTGHTIDTQWIEEFEAVLA